MSIALQLELPEGGAGQAVMSTLPKTIGVLKYLNYCGNYYLLNLSVGGSYAPGELRFGVEKPSLYEPLGRPRGLSAAETARDPEDTLWGHIGDAVIDPPGGRDVPCFNGALGRKYYWHKSFLGCSTMGFGGRVGWGGLGPLGVDT